VAKTNWDMDDTVMPADLNQIGQEINTNTAQADTLKARKINTSGGLSGGGDLTADRTLSIADSGVTDAKIGNRTVSDATAPTSDTGTPTGLLSGIVYMIKAVTGGASWRTLPGMSLAAIKTILDAATNAATASTLLKRDSSGRAKVAAPSAADDIARKTEVDAAVTTAAADATTKANVVQSSLTAHTGNAAIHTTQAEKDKLAGIAAGANLYTHPTGDGNQHMPATGTTNSGKVLKAGATAGSAAWATLTKSDISDFPASLPASGGDADTVDGYHLNQDVRSTASPSFNRVFLNVAAGTSPLAVNSSTLVVNLNADMVDGLHASTASNANTVVARDGNGDIAARTLNSGVVTGTPPIYVNSTTLVSNLNADMVDGYQTAEAATASTIAARNTNGDLWARRYTSTMAQGTAPFVVSSTTVVANLNADLLDGYNAGNVSGQIPVSNGTLNANLNADMLDGFHAANSSNGDTIMLRSSGGNVVAKTYYSDVTTGTAPLNIASTTVVPNLNVDMVDGYHLNQDVRTTASPSFLGLTVGSTAISSDASGLVVNGGIVHGPVGTLRAGYTWKVLVESSTAVSYPSYILLTPVGQGNVRINGSFFGRRGNSSTQAQDEIYVNMTISDSASTVRGFYNVFRGSDHVYPSIRLVTCTYNALSYYAFEINQQAATNRSYDTVSFTGTYYNATMTFQTTVTDVAISGVISAGLVMQAGAGNNAPPSIKASNNTIDDGTGSAIFLGGVTALRLSSTVATGTAPLQVTSTTNVINLNADMVDGAHASLTTSANTIAQRNGSGDLLARVLISSAANGIAPLTVSSTTLVTDLNADLLDGWHAAESATGNTVVKRDAAGNIIGNVMVLQAGTTAGGRGHIAMRVGNTNRFAIGLVGDESGTGNSGSNFALWNYADDGSNINTAFSIIRASGNAVFSANASANTLTSRIATGTAPITVSSSTMVSNLNTQYLQDMGRSPSATANTVANRDASGDLTSRRFISTITTGTAPIAVSSTTGVTNLNADMVDGYHANINPVASTIAVRSSSGELSATSLSAFQGITSFDSAGNKGLLLGWESEYAAYLRISDPDGSNVDFRIKDDIGTVRLSLSASGVATAAQFVSNQGIVTKAGTSNGNGVSHFSLQNGEAKRFTFNLVGTESGGNSGSMLNLVAYNDAGSYMGTPMSIERSGGVYFSGTIDAPQIRTFVTNGTPPLVVYSNTRVNSLNADMVDGLHVGNGTGQIPQSNGTVNVALNADMVDGLHANEGSVNGTLAVRRTLDGWIQAAGFASTNTTGTAPFTVWSTTLVTNLNADKVDGYDAVDLTTGVPAFALTATGTSSTFAASFSPAFTKTMGRTVRIKAHAAGGATPTLDANGTGAAPIRKPNGTAASIASGGIYTLTWDATETAFILQGEGGGYDVYTAIKPGNTAASVSIPAEALSKITNAEEGTYFSFHVKAAVGQTPSNSAVYFGVKTANAGSSGHAQVYAEKIGTGAISSIDSSGTLIFPGPPLVNLSYKFSIFN
jgi:hypothetical protein